MVAVTTAIDVGVARPVTGAGGAATGAGLELPLLQAQSSAESAKPIIRAVEPVRAARNDVMNLSCRNFGDDRN